MCVSVCQCKNCRNLFTKKVGLDCTNCPNLWGNKDVDCTFGKGVQNCPYYVSMDTQTPAYTPPPSRKPVPAPAPHSVHKLLPCPFCGGTATMMNAQKFFDRRGKYFITCLECGVETPRTGRTRKEAFAAWNRRAERMSEERWNPLGHQPTKAVYSKPPNCGSSVQKPKESDRAELFFTPEEVRKMNRTEVCQNYEAIIQSMSKW